MNMPPLIPFHVFFAPNFRFSDTMNRLFLAGLRWKGNSYKALVLSLLLVMALYSVCRIIFYLFNQEFFPGMSAGRFGFILFGGLRFDLAAVFYSNAVFILMHILPFPFRFRTGYKNAMRWIFFITNGIALTANVADVIYYRFTLRRTTLSVFSQFKNEVNIGNLVGHFVVDYWYVVLVLVALVGVLVYGYNHITFDGPQLKNKGAFFAGGLLGMLLIIYLFVGGVRGGFAHSTRPITLSNAAEYARVPKDINLVLNTPFALMRTARASVIKKVDYFTSADSLNKVFNPLVTPKDTAAFRFDNVVIIILESFSKEFVGAYNPGKKCYTPFLDSIIGVSRAYQYSMANGRRSIDAMPSVICSIPSIEIPYVLSHYSGNKVNSLASLLHEEGYYTAFFHGAPNGSMGFDAFANLAGFQDYYGKNEYDQNTDDDFDGIWGIWDEKFLQFFARKMNTFKQPFFTTVFTVSSHHPYNLPDEYKEKFTGGPMIIHRTIQYTDYSLRRFFNTAARMPWFKNTLFVFTADHASAEIQYPEYHSAWGYFAIPVFFYKPGAGWTTFKPEIVQQIDIMPTVLGYLNYPKPYVAFGRDAFAENSEPFAFNYLDNTYLEFAGDHVLEYDGIKPKALFNFKKDRMMASNLLDTIPGLAHRMETKLKAMIQQYNNRMVDDDLTPEGPQARVVPGTAVKSKP
jgi:phosphoglycerol transferase MdoB-like AlkP superfamily enzyme